jgi:epoxyqueuosine reductase
MNEVSSIVTVTLEARGAAVKRLAAELGFDACGIAVAGPVDPEDRLGAWLRRGFHADMAWMERTQALRQDISRWLPGARSVVVVALNYYQPAAEPGPRAGKVARYARGRDYHRVLLKPLRRLAAFVDTLEPGAASKACIDSGPVLERAWAARAGVGWIGKNSLVLRRDLGSWFFLGVIATTVTLPPDAPMPNYCGSCTACMEACPTRAIVASGVVDSRRCISYHTIENRGEISAEVQTAMGHWVFGCDICQEVCPWNQKVQPSSEADFRPRGEVMPLDLAEMSGMDEEAFAQRFRGTAIMRAKCAGMRRNAEIALRNIAMRKK